MDNNSLQEFWIMLKEWVYEIMPIFIGVGAGVLVSLLLS